MTQKFIERLQLERLNPYTIKQYELLMKLFEAKFKGINEENIMSFLELRNHPRARSFLRKYLAFNKKYELINVIPKIRGRKVTLPRYFSHEEIMKLSENAPFRLKILILLMYESGLRVSEAVKIRRKNVDLFNSKLRLVGKGGKEAEVWLSPQLRDLLEKACSGKIFDDRLFPGLYREKVNKELSELSQLVLFKRVNPHSLRHSLASTLLKKGVSLSVIQRIMRHSNISTTGIYTHIQDLQARAGWEKLLEKGD